MIAEQQEPTDRPTLGELAGNSRGLCCPACGWSQLPVLYTRPQTGGQTYRVRQCRRCGQRVLCQEAVIGKVKGRRHD